MTNPETRAHAIARQSGMGPDYLCSDVLPALVYVHSGKLLGLYKYIRIIDERATAGKVTLAPGSIPHQHKPQDGEELIPPLGAKQALLTSQSLEKHVQEQLDRLPLEKQRQVLEFARTLAKEPIRGVPGRMLLRFAGTIEAEDLAIIARAIQEGCEKADLDEW